MLMKNRESESSLPPGNIEGGESSVCKSAWCNRWSRANLFAVREAPKYAILLLSSTHKELHNSTRVDLCHTHYRIMVIQRYELGYRQNKTDVYSSVEQGRPLCPRLMLYYDPKQSATTI